MTLRPIFLGNQMRTYKRYGLYMGCVKRRVLKVYIVEVLVYTAPFPELYSHADCTQSGKYKVNN